MGQTLIDLAESNANEIPDSLWLRDRSGDDFRDWSWREGFEEFQAVASWLEGLLGSHQANLAILSRNRAHWIMADLAIISSGNVSVPIFTTQSRDTVGYVLDFTETKVLFVGESENWEEVRGVIPEDTLIVALPGVSLEVEHRTWEDIVAEAGATMPNHRAKEDDLVSIIFTSGSTGLPKGVMHSHKTLSYGTHKTLEKLQLGRRGRLISYLPLSHMGERTFVFVQSLLYGSQVTFVESLDTLQRDLAEVKPTIFFGVPRVFERFQQGILGKFGSQEGLDQMLAADSEGIGALVRAGLGLDQAEFITSGSAPISLGLLQWYEKLGIQICEGYGQTECMPIFINAPGDLKLGSVGKNVLESDDAVFSEEGELLFRSDSVALGYYKQPDETASTFQNGYLRTGDKLKRDDLGNYYITGRVKDYFKTIHGKYVAPASLEGPFLDNEYVDQVCLLGRGYSKTVMVCVLSERAESLQKDALEKELAKNIERVNSEIEKHARIGAVIVSSNPWTIGEGILTTTLKVKRQPIEDRYDDLAKTLALKAAETKQYIIHWD